MKRIISTILLIVWMLIIFMLSNESSVVSQNKSDKVTSTIIEITNKDISNTKKEDIISNNRFLIRNGAHFILYFILGILVVITLKTYNVNRNIILCSILMCLMYSISDEIHQLFTSGRTFKVLDILLDTMASSLSIIIMNKNRIFK